MLCLVSWVRICDYSCSSFEHHLGRIHLQRSLLAAGLTPFWITVVSARVGALANRQEVNNVDQIRAVFVPRIASTELRIAGTTVWRVLHNRLRFKPYKAQLLQSLSEENKVRRTTFYGTLSLSWKKTRDLIRTSPSAVKPRSTWMEL
jgi:hypothetical protein